MSVSNLWSGILAFVFMIITGSNVMADQHNKDQHGKQKRETAYIAAGCFWCIQKDMDKVNGVIKTEVGYMGGPKEKASYDLVSKGGTGHYEALKVVFDANVVSYAEILDVAWVNLDPYNGAGQFCDKGSQYRAAIFPDSEDQRKVAEASKEKAIKWLSKTNKDKKVVTEIVGATPFYVGEDYHQDYYKKNPLRYSFYRASCGRDRVLKEIWKGLKKLP